jgi:hypothetical protein
MLYSGHERFRETLVMGKRNNVIHAALFGDGYRPVSGTIIDDHPFDGFETFNVPWKVRQGDGQRFFFVEARNLNDKFLQIADSLQAEIASLCAIRSRFCLRRSIQENGTVYNRDEQAISD